MTRFGRGRGIAVAVFGGLGVGGILLLSAGGKALAYGYWLAVLASLAVLSAGVIGIFRSAQVAKESRHVVSA
jgi:hypothetical protein